MNWNYSQKREKLKAKKACLKIKLLSAFSESEPVESKNSFDEKD